MNVLSWAGRQAMNFFLSNFKKYLDILCCYLDNIEKNIYSERKSENVILQEREEK